MLYKAFGLAVLLSFKAGVYSKTAITISCCYFLLCSFFFENPPVTVPLLEASHQLLLQNCHCFKQKIVFGVLYSDASNYHCSERENIFYFYTPIYAFLVVRHRYVLLHKTPISQRHARQNFSHIQIFNLSHPLKTKTDSSHLLGSRGFAARATVIASKTKAGRNLVKEVDVVKGSAESVLAGAPGIHRNVGERVHALGIAQRQGAVDENTVLAVLGVGVVLAAALLLLGGHTRTILVDLVVFAVVGHSANTTSDGVAGLPVDGEIGTGAVADASILGVLGQARLFVGADGVALVALVLGLGKVFGVGRTPNARVAG